MTEPIDLDALEALAAKATEGPWVAKSNPTMCEYLVQTREAEGADVWCERPVDAEFIAAARTAVPALIARVRELEAANACAVFARNEARHFARQADDALVRVSKERDEARAALSQLHKQACRGEGHGDVQTTANCVAEKVSSLRESLDVVNEDHKNLFDTLTAERAAHAQAIATAQRVAYERAAQHMARAANTYDQMGNREAELASVAGALSISQMAKTAAETTPSLDPAAIRRDALGEAIEAVHSELKHELYSTHEYCLRRVIARIEALVAGAPEPLDEGAEAMFRVAEKLAAASPEGASPGVEMSSTLGIKRAPQRVLQELEIRAPEAREREFEWFVRIDDVRDSVFWLRADGHPTKIKNHRETFTSKDAAEAARGKRIAEWGSYTKLVKRAKPAKKAGS